MGRAKAFVLLLVLVVLAMTEPVPVAAQEASLAVAPSEEEVDEFCQQASAVFGYELAGMSATQSILTTTGTIRTEYGYFCVVPELKAGIFVYPESTLIGVITDNTYARADHHGAATLYWDSYFHKKHLICGSTAMGYGTTPSVTLTIGGQTTEIPAGEPLSEADEIGLLNNAIRVWCPGGIPDLEPSRSLTFANRFEDLLRISDYSSEDAATLRLYRAFFNREPEFGGAQYWLEERRRGVSLDTVANSFVASEEFQLTYGNTTDEEFLGIVYTNVLGRSFDQVGFDYWLGQMNSGLSRGSVVRWVASGNEFIDLYPYAPID